MKKAIALWLIIILIFSGITINFDFTTEGSVPQEKMPTYTTHSPIRINRDTDFTSGNGVTGGSGTEIDPWAIDGWEINGFGMAYGIYIGNTSECFSIQNCKIRDATGSFVSYYYTESGIIFYHVQSGNVQNCEIESNNFDGIGFYNSDNCTISGNTITGNEYGMTIMEYSNHTNISGNAIFANAYYGINLLQSGWGIVEGNNVTNNTGNGLSISESAESLLENNWISKNENGIDLWDSEKTTIVGNHIHDNVCGIYLDFSDSNDMINNNVSWNSEQGIYLKSSIGNSVYHNRLANNTIAQAFDGKSGNAWDNGYPSGGNYWSNYTGIDANADGMGDTPYTSILGGSGAKDRYPLMQPWFPDSEPPLANAGTDFSINEDRMVTFNGTLSTDNIGVVKYAWTFNNSRKDVTLIGIISTYNFTQPGIYSVTLNVTDSAGNFGLDALTVTVHDCTEPMANAGPDLIIEEGAIAIFNGSGSSDNVGIENYTWTLNDGMGNFTIWGISGSHVFPVSGKYTIKLNVSDAAGLRNEDKMQVTVNPDSIPPIADAGPDQLASINDTIMFNGTGSSDNANISNYTWNFTYNGSAIFMYGSEPTFRFWALGNYSVTLTVRDRAGNVGTDTMDVSVVKPAAEQDDALEEIDPEKMAWTSDEMLITGIIVTIIIGMLTLSLAIYFRKNIRPPTRPPIE